jgi:N6-adenosine-specific RNA methylase IME4
LLEIERALARERQKRTQFGFGGVQMNTTGKGKARDIVAKAAGLSPTTFQRAVKIIERGPEKLKEKVRHGKMSIAYAYKMILREEKNCKTPDMPSGKFNVIYADPPWEYYLPLRGSPDMHYKTMSTDEICKLSVPAADNAVLFLWATNPMLEDALKVMAAWGFKYKTNMVWVKSQIGTGSYFRGQHELLLLGVKGDVHPPEESKRLPSVLFADTQRHSEKPEEVYTIIEHMYPGRRYLELFARKRREGWVSWGDEIQP